MSKGRKKRGKSAESDYIKIRAQRIYTYQMNASEAHVDNSGVDVVVS